MTYRSLATLACLLCCLPVPAAVLAADAVGAVKVANGRVAARLGDIDRGLSVGDAVYQGERLTTGADGALLVEFRDRTKFALWHNSQMLIEQFADTGPEEGFRARVFAGTFRFVTGLIAQRRAAAVKVGLAVKTATIGIRGTHVAGEVEGEAVTVVLLEPEEDKASAITVANEFGSVDIDQPGWGTSVPDAHSPPTPARRMRMRNVENLMRSLSATRRAITAPRPH